MKIRLFWVMVVSFILVIVLGIGGMLFFFRLAIDEKFSRRNKPDEIAMEYELYADLLTDYYIAHDHSWQGIQDRIDRLNPQYEDFVSFAVTDKHGTVVATTSIQWEQGQIIDANILNNAIPIHIASETVGMLVSWETIHNDGTIKPIRHAPPPPEVVRSMLRGLIGAGVGLALVLTILSIISARNFSKPLAHVTGAADTMASGDLAVQVPGSLVYELNQLANAFNRMAQTLAEADQQRKQMMADISHELRTPLAIIKGRIEGIQDGVYEATPEQVNHLLGEIHMLERLIEDLRVLALAEAGQLALYPEEEDPVELLEDTTAAFLEQAESQGVALRLDVAENLPIIDVDAQRINQVLANLVTNALRYTPAGGYITLSGKRYNTTGEETTGVVLQVRDTGQGIKPEDVPHIFDRFWRADHSRNRGSGGTGLGLAIARQIVVAHGGSITAESTLNEGTTMRIVLPASQR